MKTCIRCNLPKDVGEFGVRTSSPDGRNSSCKTCKRAYDNLHYKTHPNRRVVIEAHRKKARLVTKQYIWDYLASHPCVGCGETDPVVLQFDHQDSTLKTYNISNMGNYSVATVKKEIDKCDVRCANCHIKRTAMQFNWYVGIDRVPK